ncbi:MAG: TIGR01777 family oxidoreductase [bacterium]|jgi:uncharacterized protein (TIGR01777 family)
MKVLISGGSGLLGKEIERELISKGHEVLILSRKKSSQTKNVFWDIEKQTIEFSKIVDVEAIIHLAGEGIADKRWSNERKQAIIDSRVNSTMLLEKFITNHPNKVKHFISASAVGYYSNRGEELLTEESSAAKDFLGETCVLWERAVDKIASDKVRVVKLRIGIVLTLKGGALKQMILPFYAGLGSALGDGKQWMSWIDSEDLARMFVYSLENTNMQGVYNAVAPEPVRNNEFGKVLSKVMHRPYWAPSVPTFIINTIFGEMAQIILGSIRVSADKILSSGFQFKYSKLESSLVDILKNKR